MKYLLSFFLISALSLGGKANTSDNDPTSENKVEISPRVENNYLSIDVDDELSGVSVTVSVFNSIGEIVLETTLGLGVNKIDVQGLPNGDYVAVVRENGDYASKSSFVVE